MRKQIIALSIVLFASVSASAVEAGKVYVPFEAGYPTFVLSDDSKARPQPFEAEYPVVIAQLGIKAAVAKGALARKEPFEANYPTYVLSDDSKANPQPFEANYPVFINQPLDLVSTKKGYVPFEDNFPTYVLKCSGVTPAPFEDCFPVSIMKDTGAN